MPMTADYRGPTDLPGTIPVFPLPGALLLPRGQMPLNIFEPRYLAMVDDCLRDGHRLIGMIQPDPAHSSQALGGRADQPPLHQARVSHARFADDFIARKGEREVDRKAVLRALADFMKANDLKADWEDIDKAPNEALVNALAMMSPSGPD